MQSRKPSRLHKRTKWITLPLWGLLHLLGTLFVFVIISILVLPPKTALHVFWLSVTAPEIQADSIEKMGIQLALSAVIWTFFACAAFMSRKRKKQSKKRVLKRSAGTVLTETLIILPPFLLLTFGLAQYSLNNIAHILANVAVYKAARSAWVWFPETRGGGQAQASQRASVAAAAVMTPVAPGDFFQNIVTPDDSTQQMRLAFAASQIPGGGVNGGTLGNAIAALGSGSLNFEKSMDVALDNSTFIQRSLRKFTHARAATTVQASAGGVTLTYNHMQAMPVVGPVFTGATWWNPLAGAKFVGGRPGYYLTITRTVNITAQKAAPNDQAPFTGFFGNSGGGGGGAEGQIRDVFPF